MSGKFVLIIVESPAKCSKIEKFLKDFDGKKYIVKASKGHFVNINKKKGIKAINISGGFKPDFIIDSMKSGVVKSLKDLVNKSNCEKVIIATDLDREGEGIGWHLITRLGLNLQTTERILFSEISKKAICDAIKNPQKLNMDLVNAQFARQTLDFLIGFLLSPVLWTFVKRGLSAGRCQMPTLHLLNTKESEIDKFNSKTYFDLSGIFKDDDSIMYDAKSSKQFSTKALSSKALTEFQKAIFTIEKIKFSEHKSNPPEPYITSTIQQDASNKLGMSPSTTMRLLQKLYESGKITYMRTDSKTISSDTSKKIKSYVMNNYGSTFYKKRTFNQKNSKNAQEAHECLRPVNIQDRTIQGSFTSSERSLYNLIWRRTVGSQMSEMITKKMTVVIGNDKNKLTFQTAFSKTLFLGFGKIHDLDMKNEIDTILSKVTEGKVVEIKQIVSNENMTKPPGRYSQASLVRELEKQGIGRPSTFSSIIDTLVNRNYIEVDSKDGEDKEILIYELNSKKEFRERMKTVKINTETRKIFVTDIGKIVDKFMNKNFNEITESKFTAMMETDLDKIAKGNLERTKMLGTVYTPLNKKVNDLLKNKPATKLYESTKTVVGINPKNGKEIFCYKAKHGPVIQEGKNKKDGLRFVGLPKGFHTKTATLDQLLPFLEVNSVGQLDGESIEVHTGSLGVYLKHGGKTYGVTDKSLKIRDITLTMAKKIIADKKKSIVKEFPGTGIQIRIGDHGPYIIKFGTTKTKKKSKPKIVGVPEEFKDAPHLLTLDECVELLNKKVYKPKFKRKYGAGKKSGVCKKK